jgi:hypothetical protein
MYENHNKQQLCRLGVVNDGLSNRNTVFSMRYEQNVYTQCMLISLLKQFTNVWESPDTLVRSCAMAKLNETGGV